MADNEVNTVKGIFENDSESMVFTPSEDGGLVFGYNVGGKPLQTANVGLWNRVKDALIAGKQIEFELIPTHVNMTGGGMVRLSQEALTCLAAQPEILKNRVTLEGQQEWIDKFSRVQNELKEQKLTHVAPEGLALLYAVNRFKGDLGVKDISSLGVSELAGLDSFFEKHGIKPITARPSTEDLEAGNGVASIDFRVIEKCSAASKSLRRQAEAHGV